MFVVSSFTNQIFKTAFLLVLAIVLVMPVQADDELGRRSSWQPLDAAAVKAQLDLYLKDQTLEETTKLKIETLWPRDGSPTEGSALLEQLAVTFALVDDSTRELVLLCREQTAPVVLPKFDLLQDQSKSSLVRNNLRLLYGRWLAQHDLYDESLQQIQNLSAVDVVDPASLLFYQSIGYHRLLNKEKCLPALSKLLENEKKIPRRYQQLARLMEADLKPLKTDSLDEISRIMRNIQNRLLKGRAGARVRKEEDDVVAKLDKIIEKLEKQQGRGGGSGSGGGAQPLMPMQDSNIAGNKGPGNVDPNKPGHQGDWGDLPAKDRQAALQEIAKDLPAHYREVIEAYFRKLAKDDPR